MAKHTGQPCFTCGETLLENDDIVVCPDCGTPYHRTCWKKNNCCINTKLHESGESWKPTAAVSETQEKCPNCGTPNAPEELHCVNCGAALHEPQQTRVPSWESAANDSKSKPSHSETLRSRLEETAGQMHMNDTYCGMNQEDTLGGERLGDVADFVEHNTLYYLPKFRRFHDSGRHISFNFPCLFFPQLYFANRKMWLFALLLTAVMTFLQVPQIALTLQETLPDMITSFQNPDSTMLSPFYADANMTAVLQNMLDKLNAWENIVYNAATICNYARIFVEICLGLLGNYIYYRFVLKRVHKIRSENLPDHTRRTRLRMQGGTNGWLMLGMIVLNYVFLLLLTIILFTVLML